MSPGVGSGSGITIATVITVLAYSTVVLLALSLLVALLCGVLMATDTKKITLRAWLALAWLATLLIPGLAEVGFLALHYIVGNVTAPTAVRVGQTVTPPSPIYQFNTMFFGAGLVITPVVVFLLTMVCIAWLTGRVVLRPLTAMSEAAQRIAAGDLDVALSEPQMREVAEVASAFNAMGKALHASITRQAELEQERRLFVSAVAHDLRTPIFALRGYLEGLERGLADTPEKSARYIQVCQQQADTLEHRVADLFAYARLEYLEQEPCRESLELGALLRGIVEAAQPRAESLHIMLDADGPEYECPLKGDAHLLTRAIENLLDNALRYTPAGGEVRMEWRQETSRYVFRVRDSGPGFAPQDIPHLFTPLYRGETSRNRSTGGAGLGLAVARSILLKHGGEMRARNVCQGEGCGAEVTGTLPMGEQGEKNVA